MINRKKAKELILDYAGRKGKAALNRNTINSLKSQGLSSKDAARVKRNMFNTEISDRVIKDKTIHTFNTKKKVVGSYAKRHRGKIALGAATLGTAAVIKRKNDNRKNGTTDKVKPVGKTKLNTKNKRRSN